MGKLRHFVRQFLNPVDGMSIVSIDLVGVAKSMYLKEPSDKYVEFQRLPQQPYVGLYMEELLHVLIILDL